MAGNIPHFASRRSNEGVSAFREIVNIQHTGRIQSIVPVPVALEDVEIFTTAGYRRMAEVVVSAILFINNEGEPERKSKQICAWYCSALMAVFSGIKESCLEVFKQHGCRVYEVTDDLVDTASAPMYTNYVPFNHILVLVGQLALIPYQNIGDQNYENFMKSTTNAIKASVGAVGLITIPGTDNNSENAIDRGHAKVIRAMMGCMHNFRAVLLDSILLHMNQAGPYGNLCGYLANILAWTEMSSMVFIHDSLVLSKSPVLTDERVIGEVKNLCEAYEMIINTEAPQYFMIRYPYSSTRIMDRSRFPVLLAVAQKIRNSRYFSTTQFVSTLGDNNPLVIELHTLHKEAMTSRAAAQTGRHIRFLFR